MTAAMSSLLGVVNVAMLGYFVVLNAVYTTLLVLGWTEGSRYVARRQLADFTDIRQSALTTPISILVPAYNEQPVIVDSVRALLRAEYPLHEVIVVNDGSTDDTLGEMIRAYSLVAVRRVPRAGLPSAGVVAVYTCPEDDRLVVVDKRNGGKADAINAALNYARYPLFCTVDSDTIIDDDALLRLVRPFQDQPETVACGGVVRIVNGSTVVDGRVVDVRTPRRLLANIQIVEYLRSFLAGRTGWARIGGLLVISGAFGVFRREVVIAAGGYDTATVGEDAELVVRLHRHCRDLGIPYRIQSLADPVCWTQAPESLSVLARQRDRWHRGLLELLWRHRGMFCRRRYGVVGWVAMPYFLVFEALGPVIEVVGYAAAVLALAFGVVDARIAIALMVLSLTYGLVLSFGALLIEDRAYRRYRSWRCVAHMIGAAVVENFGYRQWHSAVRARSFVTLARGAGWGEMTRTRFDGTALQPTSPVAVPAAPPAAAPVLLPALAPTPVVRPPAAPAPAGRRRRRAGTIAIAGLAAATVAGVAATMHRQEPRAAASSAPVTASPTAGPASAAAGTAVAPFVPVVEDGLRLPARATSTSLEIGTPAGFEPRFWPGVNLGATTPGHAPGELAISRADVDRWLAGMGRLGIRVVRIYTILPPSFYDALRAYDLQHPSAPIFLIHGVWIPEEDFLAHGDLYRPSVVRAFRAEIADAVGVVHGDADIPPVAGHAAGRYRSDVSPWLLAWSPGIEWDPRATAASDRANAGAPAYHGRFVTTRGDPTPTESWIASMLDHLAELEASRGWSRPLTFTNWLTADPLRHPEEPLPDEDRVSVDAMHLTATGAWPGGFFASYHAYPYYPDFLRLSREYAAYRGADGAVDPYAGYLHALRAHHRDQAVMVTEFGVPSGPGVAHRGPLGRDQGDHSETEAMAMDASMLRDIHAEGFAGGIVFEWSDEWFKHTWNTMDYEQPEARRALWRDAYTNEEQFGLLSQDTQSPAAAALDGVADGWARSGDHRILEAPASAAVREVDALVDPEYLTLRVETSQAGAWLRRPLTIGLDIVPGGNRGLPGLPGTMPAADVAVVLGPGRRARLLRAAGLDPVRAQFGSGGRLGYLDVPARELRRGSGAWVAPLLMLNRPYVVPTTGERRPVETVDLSQLPWGSGDPRAADGDTRRLVDAGGTTIELRIPWLVLGFSDPSSHLAMVLRQGEPALVRADRIGIGVAVAGGVQMAADVTWPAWNAVTAHERLKQGVGTLAAAFVELGREPVAAPATTGSR